MDVLIVTLLVKDANLYTSIKISYCDSLRYGIPILQTFAVFVHDLTYVEVKQKC